MSSFANLKRGRSDLAKLTKAIEATSQPAEAGSKDDTRFWQPEVDKAGNGMAVLRFLPAPAADGDDADGAPGVAGTVDFVLLGASGTVTVSVSKSTYGETIAVKDSSTSDAADVYTATVAATATAAASNEEAIDAQQAAVKAKIAALESLVSFYTA